MLRIQPWAGHCPVLRTHVRRTQPGILRSAPNNQGYERLQHSSPPRRRKPRVTPRPLDSNSPLDYLETSPFVQSKSGHSIKLPTLRGLDLAQHQQFVISDHWDDPPRHESPITDRGPKRRRRFYIRTHVARRSNWGSSFKKGRPVRAQVRAIKVVEHSPWDLIVNSQRERRLKPNLRNPKHLPAILRADQLHTLLERDPSIELRAFQQTLQKDPYIPLSLNDWSLDASIRWRRNMSRIDASFPENGQPRNIRPKLDQDSFVPLVKDYARARSQRLRRSLIDLTWINLSRVEKQQHAESALLLCLNDAPMLAFRILKDLDREDIRMPIYVIQDVLDHIAAARLTEVDPKTSSHHRTLVKAILDMVLYAIKHWGHRSAHGTLLGQRLLRSLVTRLDGEQLASLLENLSAHRCVLTVESKGHFIYQLTRLNEFEAALRVLETVSELDRNAVFLHGCYVFMLYHNYPVEDAHEIYRIRRYVLQKLLDLGVRPGNGMRNAVIYTSMIAGDVDAAWEVLRVTEESGLVPTSDTFRAVLRGSEWKGYDLIAWVLERARYTKVLDQRLGVAIMTSLRRLQIQTAREKVFEETLTVYSQIFDVSPLQDLGLIRTQESHGPSTGALVPHPMAITSVLYAWCREHEGDASVIDAYERYMYHVLNGHSLIEPTARFPHGFNAYLMGMRSLPSALHICTDVVRDMLFRPPTDKYHHIKTRMERRVRVDVTSSEESGIALPSPSKSPRHHHSSINSIAQPSIYTWNILLFAYLRAGELDAAEKVLTLMQSNAVEPSEVTWNTLVSGYTRLGEAEKGIEAVERMERAGHEADDFTRRALAFAPNREALLEALEHAMQRRDQSKPTSAGANATFRPVNIEEQGASDVHFSGEKAPLDGEAVTLDR